MGNTSEPENGDRRPEATGPAGAAADADGVDAGSVGDTFPPGWEPNLLETILQEASRLSRGGELFERMILFVRERDLPEGSLEGPCDEVAARHMLEYILQDRFGDSFLQHPLRNQWLDWVLDRLLQDPVAYDHLQRLWGSICQRILSRHS